MPPPKNQRISVLLLLVYAMGLLLVAPHVDLDGISGSGKTELAAHADADNCKHIPISQLDSCALCSSVEGRAVLTPAPFRLEILDADPVTLVFAFSPSSSFALLNSFCRRGPPTLLA